MWERRTDGKLGRGATGGLATGVAMHPMLSDQSLEHVLVHEIGHVLGLRHRHEDGLSVMSYLRVDRSNEQPSAEDYLACNRAIKRRFGIDIDLPPADAPGQTMTDQEALERAYRDKR